MHVDVAAAVNHAPTVDLPAGNSANPSAGQSLLLSSLFSGSDIDGNTLTYYVYDANSVASSGYVEIDGSIVAAETITPMTATQFAQATFIAGDAGMVDDIFVQAFDGQAYSGWNSFVHVAVPAAVNHAPTVDLLAGSSANPGAGQSLLLSSLFSGSDIDGNALTYFVYDSNSTANSGYVEIDGNIVTAETITPMTATQFAQATFVAGGDGAVDDIFVQAFDGQAYSGWNSLVHVAVPAAVNHAPTVDLLAGSSANPSAGQSLLLSSLFSGSDIDGDALTYFVYDSNSAANSGYVQIDGNIVTAETIMPMTAAQLALATFIAGDAGTVDDIYVQASDGQLYSGWNTSVHIFV